jgi:hypothetical protein
MKTPDELAAIAIELTVRVRDEQPDANDAWLRKALPGGKDLLNLCIVLAAAVPIDQSWTQLTAWTWVRSALAAKQSEADPEPEPKKRRKGTKPCGTRSAAQRHRYHGEPPCSACREAEREWDRNRKRVDRLAESLALVPQEDA